MHKFISKKALDEWDSCNIFNDSWKLVTESGKTFEIPRWYAQPDKIEGQLFQPIVDPHHLYVNNRSRCCTKGMNEMGIAPEAWWNVAKASKQNKTGLSWEIAKELRDRQSNAYAQTTFSKAVQNVMESNGDVKEAEWCMLLRNWYKAIDDAGIELDKRIDWLFQMREKLLPYLKVGHFPPPGAYVAGLPMAQFEGIITNVDRRLQLYAMVKDQRYNQRAITSLDSETFFSGFQDYDPKGSGVLRPDDIPIALGAAQFLYQQRLNANRKFVMRTSRRTRVYPVQVASTRNEFTSTTENDVKDANNDIVDMFTTKCIYAKSHFFDVEERKTIKPKRKSGVITEFGKPGRGAEGARSYHRSNEEKILPHRRFGLMDNELFK